MGAVQLTAGEVNGRGFDDGTNTTSSMSEIKLTSQGIEGRFTSPSVNGCREDATFSAVRQ